MHLEQMRAVQFKQSMNFFNRPCMEWNMEEKFFMEWKIVSI